MTVIVSSFMPYLSSGKHRDQVTDPWDDHPVFSSSEWCRL